MYVLKHYSLKILDLSHLNQMLLLKDAFWMQKKSNKNTKENVIKEFAIHTTISTKIKKSYHSLSSHLPQNVQWLIKVKKWLDKNLKERQGHLDLTRKKDSF